MLSVGKSQVAYGAFSSGQERSSPAKVEAETEVEVEVESASQFDYFCTDNFARKEILQRDYGTFSGKLERPTRVESDSERAPTKLRPPSQPAKAESQPKSTAVPDFPRIDILAEKSIMGSLKIIKVTKISLFCFEDGVRKEINSAKGIAPGTLTLQESLDVPYKDVEDGIKNRAYNVNYIFKK